MKPRSDPPGDAELRSLLAGEISAAREREIADWLEGNAELRDRLAELSGEANFSDEFGAALRTTLDLAEESGDTDRFDLAWLAPPQSEDSIGRIGKFEVLGVSGSGGMGTVFRARDPDLNRIVAIKVLRPSRAEDEKIVARFRHEASAIAAIDHPHVLPIYEIGEIEEGCFLVMRFVEGETLDQRLENHPEGLPVPEAIRISIAISRALEAAHAKGIIHRDVNPSNVMLDEEGHVWLMDFGLAESIVTPNQDPDRRIAGTPQFMAPEQVEPGARIDTRTDLFGLGATLHSLLSGQAPHACEDLVQILWETRHEPVPEIDRPGLPPELRKLVQRLLEKDPTDRPASATEVIRQLRRIEKPPLWSRRSVKAFAAAVVAFALGALALLAVRHYHEANPFVTSEGHRFPTLEAAAQSHLETEEATHIVVQGNGPYFLTPANWQGAVSISAGKGFLPVFEAEPGDEPVWTSTGELSLRGLTIRYPASEDSFELFLRIDSGSFTAEHCRFAMPESAQELQRALPKRALIDFSQANEVDIDRCEFIGREMTCFVSQAESQSDGTSHGPSLRLRENAVRARSLVQFESPTDRPAPLTSVLLEDNVVRVHNVFVFGERERGQRASFVPVEIVARRNVFEGRFGVAFVSSRLGGRVQEWLQWKGEGNCFGMEFISSDRGPRDGVAFPRSLPEWRHYIDSPETGSVHAKASTLLDFQDNGSTLPPTETIFEDLEIFTKEEFRSRFQPNYTGPRAAHGTDREKR